MNPKKYILIIASLWLSVFLFSMYWNVAQSRKATENNHLLTAKAFFQQILVTRSWNAKHGGIYLMLSEVLQPNPYLETANRDIISTEGMQLTKVNPAYMTRLISGIAKEEGKLQFHITSLNPINPDNKPYEWERKALTIFEQESAKEYSKYFKSNGNIEFRYIAPLVTEKSCLQCHRKQGYKVGDVRGGISITFPVYRQPFLRIIYGHLALMVTGLIFIYGFGIQIIQLTEKLKKQSHVDGLTQLANRTYFDTCLHREWLRCRRLHAPLTLIMCDIDHFKQYNDSYGHQAGDHCLKLVAKSLSHMTTRPTDMVARYGGEEFIAILPETSRDGGKVVAELMQAAIEKLRIPHEASTSSDHITLSFGVATMGNKMIKESDLIEQADKALYISKERGRNLVTHIEDANLSGKQKE